MPGKMIDHVARRARWRRAKAEAESGEGSSGKRRMSAMAAVVALAAVAGALGGALATAGLGHIMGARAVVAGRHNSSALEASWRGSMPTSSALKAGVEHTSKLATGQFNKTSDRLDKVEKAQAEPAAKLAKLSEAVEKLRAAPAPRPGCRRRAGAAQRKSRVRCRSPSRLLPPPPQLLRPSPTSAGCRGWKAGCCVTSPMAAR